MPHSKTAAIRRGVLSYIVFRDGKKRRHYYGEISPASIQRMGAILDSSQSINRATVRWRSRRGWWHSGQYTTRSGRLTAVEAYGGFFLYHKTDTGEVLGRGMGDGVDMYHDDDGPINVGTLLFYRTLAADLEENERDYLEAYFGE